MARKGPKIRQLEAIDKIPLKPPKPVRGMHETARTVWKRIVNAYQPDQFKPQHYDILRMFCESAAVNKIVMKEYIDGGCKDASLLRVADKMAGRCQGLSVKLGINVNNRMAHRGQKGESQKPKSEFGDLISNG